MHTFHISNLHCLIHSLKYLRSTTFGFKEIGFKKSEFVAKTQFLFTVRLRNKIIVSQIVIFSETYSYIFVKDEKTRKNWC